MLFLLFLYLIVCNSDGLDQLRTQVPKRLFSQELIETDIGQLSEAEVQIIQLADTFVDLRLILHRLLQLIIRIPQEIVVLLQISVRTLTLHEGVLEFLNVQQHLLTIFLLIRTKANGRHRFDVDTLLYILSSDFKLAVAHLHRLHLLHNGHRQMAHHAIPALLQQKSAKVLQLVLHLLQSSF